MKLGIILSVVLVILVSVVGTIAYRGIADDPTPRTAPEKLVKVALPAGLPAVFTPDEPSADATPVYQQAVAYYKAHTKELDPQKFNSRAADELAALLVTGMKAGKVSTPLFDEMIPVVPGALPEFGDALEVIPAVVLGRAAQLEKAGDKAGAELNTLAVFAFSQRLFENSVRLYIRNVGLGNLPAAGMQLYPLLDDQPAKQEALAKWGKAVEGIGKTWDDRLQFVLSVRPQIADLIVLSLHDQDMTFRLEAVLKLGVMKFNAGGRGNRRVLADAIATLQNDPDPVIAYAAKAADEFTIEQMRKIK
jgi:hypothetical protein